MTGCHQEKSPGIDIFTAGQRSDPTRRSNYVWKLNTAFSLIGRVEMSLMFYKNWDRSQPKYRSGYACVCMGSARSYKWAECRCNGAGVCSVCEIDLWLHKRACTLHISERCHAEGTLCLNYPYKHLQLTSTVTLVEVIDHGIWIYYFFCNACVWRCY